MVPYLDAVRAENNRGELRYYPGSPRLVRRLLRPDDRMVLTELNRKDCEELHGWFARDRQVKVELMDGYQALKAFLPPPQKRGLVFVDSSFDRSKEFERLTQGFQEAHRRFATAIHALWYPLMEPTAMRAFERGIVATGIAKILQLELSVLPDDWTGGMRGCGMLVANPPFGFEEMAAPMLGWLVTALSQDSRSGARIRWLIPE
jgi:23S rRNA (adenine2030-N6)-methyltransferase